MEMEGHLSTVQSERCRGRGPEATGGDEGTTEPIPGYETNPHISDKISRGHTAGHAQFLREMREASSQTTEVQVAELQKVETADQMPELESLWRNRAEQEDKLSQQRQDIATYKQRLKTKSSVCSLT